MESSFSYEKIETVLGNVSFLCLFFSMIAYWIQVSGFLQKQVPQKNIPVLQPQNEGSVVEFSNSVPTSPDGDVFANLPSKKEFGNQKIFGLKRFHFGSIAILSANFALLTLLCLRWLESGHFPLSNLYESLMFLCWALTSFHFILENRTENSMIWFGAITSPTAFFTNAFANFSLPIEMQRSSALVPALQSNWLMMHVTVMILSYAALIFGSLLSIGFLILTSNFSSEEYDSFLNTKSFSRTKEQTFPAKLRWAESLDNMSYRMLGIGFPLLTIGILSGAVWANEAWGSYWSWDPKETWALLTWFVFAIYLHTRITKNWQGKKPAFIASLGFVVVWICYLGVNLLGEGLHSYGWLQF
jgi:cytochrome c-type biogenesis protein CcsB